MYLIFRCDCGRALYVHESNSVKRCVCGRLIKVKSRRILGKVNSFEEASEIVRKLQEENMVKQF